MINIGSSQINNITQGGGAITSVYSNNVMVYPYSYKVDTSKCATNLSECTQYLKVNTSGKSVLFYEFDLETNDIPDNAGTSSCNVKIYSGDNPFNNANNLLNENYYSTGAGHSQYTDSGFIVLPTNTQEVTLYIYKVGNAGGTLKVSFPNVNDYKLYTNFANNSSNGGTCPLTIPNGYSKLFVSFYAATTEEGYMGGTRLVTSSITLFKNDVMFTYCGTSTSLLYTKKTTQISVSSGDVIKFMVNRSRGTNIENSNIANGGINFIVLFN